MKPLDNSSATSSLVKGRFCSALCQLERCTDSGVFGNGSVDLVGETPDGGISGPNPVRTPSSKEGNRVVSGSRMIRCRADKIC